jgi:hypothetical protein
MNSFKMFYNQHLEVSKAKLATVHLQSPAWWYTPIILAPRRLKEEDWRAQGQPGIIASSKPV